MDRPPPEPRGQQSTEGQNKKAHAKGPVGRGKRELQGERRRQSFPGKMKEGGEKECCEVLSTEQQRRTPSFISLEEGTFESVIFRGQPEKQQDHHLFFLSPELLLFKREQHTVSLSPARLSSPISPVG